MIRDELGIFTKENRYDPELAMTATEVRYREMLVALELRMKIDTLQACSFPDERSLASTPHPDS